MRLLGILLSVTLTASVATAGEDAPAAKPAEPKPPEAAPAARPKVPLRVVRMLPDTHQALLFDKNRGTHVLAEVGGTIEGYTVEGIEDDEVTLSTEGGAEIVLAAPDRRAKVKRIAETDDRPATPATPTGPQPQDPYADAEIRSVDAPHAIEAGDGGVRVAQAPSASTTPAPTATPSTIAPNPVATPAPTAIAPTATTATTTPTPTAMAPTARPATTTPATTTPATTTPATTTPATTATPATKTPIRTVIAPTATTAPSTAAVGASLGATLGGSPPSDNGVLALSRADVSVAIADFSKLAASVRAVFVAGGVRIDGVADASVFAKAGLRTGDIVTAVDGRPLRSLDDAAELYARASTIKRVGLQVLRAGKPVTLRITIQ